MRRVALCVCVRRQNGQKIVVDDDYARNGDGYEEDEMGSMLRYTVSSTEVFIYTMKTTDRPTSMPKCDHNILFVRLG